ncbi:hypothetical protein CUR178_07283 [Leishmania enriettii]|uniref:Uncharacterized protein n=1 Tax=Leishmania enriettii TaxID=5663 RepID=A0A836HXJ8_LEIEN|nr:hypothetical protein CUR178_07283 [Leishmania enriettii]
MTAAIPHRDNVAARQKSLALSTAVFAGSQYGAFALPFGLAAHSRATAFAAALQTQAMRCHACDITFVTYFAS